MLPTGPRWRASGRPPRALAATPALVLLLLGGLALRLTIAYVLFPASGLRQRPRDVRVVGADAWRSTARAASTPTPGFSDYPPGYLYVLWPIGADRAGVRRQRPGRPGRRRSSSSRRCSSTSRSGYVLYRLVLGWAWPGRRAEALALGAAALYVFNPVTFYDSALWGQTDAAGALVLLLGVAALVRGNSEGAAALGVARGAGQAPVRCRPRSRSSAVVLLQRHLLRPGSGPRSTARGARRGCGAGWPGEQGPAALVTSLAGRGSVTFHVVALPFGMGVPSYLRADERHGGRLPVPVGQRLQPLGAHRLGRHTRRWPMRRDLVVRHRAAAGAAPGRGRSAPPCSSRASCGLAAARLRRGRPLDHHPRRALPVPRFFVLPDARPRALPVPGVRVPAAARGHVAALAGGARGAGRRLPSSTSMRS